MSNPSPPSLIPIRMLQSLCTGGRADLFLQDDPDGLSSTFPNAFAEHHRTSQA